MLRGYAGSMTICAAIAQLVERIHGKDEVSGSSPDRGSKLEIFQKPWRNVRRFLWCSIK